jgi:hypothetical protein
VFQLEEDFKASNNAFITSIPQIAERMPQKRTKIAGGIACVILVFITESKDPIDEYNSLINTKIIPATQPNRNRTTTTKKDLILKFTALNYI